MVYPRATCYGCLVGRHLVFFRGLRGFGAYLRSPCACITWQSPLALRSQGFSSRWCPLVSCAHIPSSLLITARVTERLDCHTKRSATCALPSIPNFPG